VSRNGSLWAGLSLALYAASLALPVGKDEGPPRIGLESLVLGGYFCAGAGLTPANLLAAAGWVFLARGRRRPALLAGASALVVGVAGVIPLAAACDVPAYPAWWVWMASFTTLTAGAWLLPQGPAENRLGGAAEPGKGAELPAVGPPAHTKAVTRPRREWDALPSPVRLIPAAVHHHRDDPQGAVLFFASREVLRLMSPPPPSPREAWASTGR
jgi:hypothetical protein